MRITSAFALFALIGCHTLSTQGQTAGTAGAFARMGFGARGVAMGNALTAVTNGEVATYYNPALSAFSSQRTASATFTFLSLDRYLNFLSYTQPLQPMAGLSVGIINGGVRDIDGRDGDGSHTENYSTYENQFFLSFSNRVEENISLGVTVKLLHSKLFEEVKSTTVGFDIGVLIRPTESIAIGASIQDLNSKYRWDTKSIYQSNGRTTEDTFPYLSRIGVTYEFPAQSGILSIEFENSSEKTNLMRFGAEYTILENFSVRGGLDRWEFSDQATGVKPSFGFTVKNSYDGWSPALAYAYVIESFAPGAIHLITLSTGF